ncbi:hybrid signal transduction histidine kinase M, partial [Tanacetum coccineum]
DTKRNGFIEFLSFLHDGYHFELELPNKLWPKNLLDNTNFVELINAKANVHLVKMDRYYEDDAWSFNGNKWVDFIKTVKDLGPKIIHLEQIDVNKFLVNFYTKDGDEVYYGFTKHHDEKCVVLGCTDPNMYQPIPHRMMLNRKVNRSGKRVPIEFNGDVSDIHITYSFCSKLKRLVGAAFTGEEWEKLCEAVMFSSTKALIISSNEHVNLFVAKVINGFVWDNVNEKFAAARELGEFSNDDACSEKSFSAEYNSFTDTKGYLSIPASFHCHNMRCDYRKVWIRADLKALQITADSIVKSWIFLTLSSTLRKRLIKANPKTAKAGWDAIETIFQDNKRTRTISLKGELRVIQMGDQTADEYFSKIEVILTLLTDLGSDMSDDDVVTYAINGLSDKYGSLAQIIAHKDLFPDLATVRSMVATEELRLHSRSSVLPTGTISSAPQVLLAEALSRNQTGWNNHERDNRTTTREVCRNFRRGFCRWGNACHFLHDSSCFSGTPRNSNNSTTHRTTIIIIVQT